MVRILLLSLAIASVVGQDFIDSIICPVPGNPSPATVTEDDCSTFSACEFTDGVCHMKKNNEAGYLVSSDPVDTGRGFYVTLDKIDEENTLFGADIQQLNLEVIYHENYHVQIKIYDPNDSRYEVPIPLSLPEEPDSDPLYAVSVGPSGSPLTLNVTRTSNGNELLRLAGPLTFEDQFIQITHRLPSDYLYGIGEHPHTTLRHIFDPRQTYPIFSRDQIVTPSEVNQYGAQPYYVNMEDNEGNTHSVLLYNSNAMEFSTFYLGDNVPALTIRTIGGILDFHIFMGPTPEDVNVQYVNTVGLPAFPPYWAFGFQLSRWGYDTIDNYREVYNRMKDAQIPWDTQVFDIDYMYRWRDFTYDPERFGDFPQLIEELHNDSMKVILMFDPALVVDWDNYSPSERGREQDVFIKWGSSDLVPDDQPEGALEYIVGYVWPDNKTVFPDFMNPVTSSWWSNELQLFKQELNYDGIWIDMNEPANFGTNLDKPFNWPSDQPDWSLKCPNNSIENPPYATLAAFSEMSESQRLSDKTICMSAVQTDGTNIYSHYDVHSIYGITESIVTYNAWSQDLFPEYRPFILSRSTFIGSGKYAVHWLGDNTANWQQLAMSIIGLIEFNMFGIPFVGADVCGFFEEPDEELCVRWMQLGAFYPFDRNHNTNGTADQDPARPGWDLAPVLSREVLLLRYKYIPYMYARFHRAHMNGYSVIRGLFNVFPSDVIARDIDDQFMWSTDLMVAPVIQQGAISRDVYFPQGLWYDIETGSLEATGPINKNILAPLEKIPVYVRGGSILPFQEPGVTTVESRGNPFGFTVALDEDLNAVGEVFWDDGYEEHVMSETFLGDIAFVENELSLSPRYDPTIADGITLETIQFFGFPANPEAISINGEDADPTSWTYDDTTGVLVLSLSVNLNEALNILLNYQN